MKLTVSLHLSYFGQYILLLSIIVDMWIFSPYLCHPTVGIGIDLICNHFGGFHFESLIQTKIPNICWFQLLTCEDTVWWFSLAIMLYILYYIVDEYAQGLYLMHLQCVFLCIVFDDVSSSSLFGHSTFMLSFYMLYNARVKPFVTFVSENKLKGVPGLKANTWTGLYCKFP